MLRNISLLVLLIFTALPATAGTYTAATCSQADVNAVINGPTHTAVDGDVINIPSGSCTWSSGITVPAGIGITIIGNGTPNIGPGTSGAGTINTTITSNAGSPLITANPTFGNSTTRLSTLKITLGTSTTVPLIFVGTCASGGCPNLRLDNLIIPTSNFCSVSDATAIVVTNVFGVADHNTVGDVVSGCNGVDFLNISHSVWQGTGIYGDNSWFVADTTGTSQVFYLENNVFNYAFGTDTDGSDSYGHVGGGRLACRFNTFNNVTTAGACGGHGTETTGRPRGIRQGEFYKNTLSGTYDAAMGYRSGTGVVWGNSFGGTVNSYLTLNDERLFRATIWGYCDGANPFDVDDGKTVVSSQTISTYSSPTITVSGTPWTANAYNFSSSSPGPVYYFVYDLTTGERAGITSNTANTLTVGWKQSNNGGTFGSQSFQNGDSIRVYSVTLYAAGTQTGSSGTETLTDSTKTWTTNQWAGYNVLDVTIGQAWQVGSNTSNTASYFNVPDSGWTFTNGDQYVILRATQCLDQPAVSDTFLLSGDYPTPPSTAQALDPTYEFADTGSVPGSIVGRDSYNEQSNRNYYFEVSQSAQSSATSPFNGTVGTGYGTLANRPTTCTTGVGYWATDQGSWNTSGSGGQGQLYLCTATNTWTLSYIPYAYPHPLIAGGGAPGVGFLGVVKVSGAATVQ